MVDCRWPMLEGCNKVEKCNKIDPESAILLKFCIKKAAKTEG